MALRDPVAVYNAANNDEANLLCHALAAVGIEAFAIEDVSQVGTWLGGLIPEIHKPQVWVERSDVERAAPILEEYEYRAAELRAGAGDSEASVDVICDECGKLSPYPAAQVGSVQSCFHCGAFVDVGAVEEWAEDDETAAEPP